MAALPETAVFYAVLIAPGFIAVMTAISLAAIEQDTSRFVLLVWSLVTSILIDTVAIGVYQVLVEPITSVAMLGTILITPQVRVGYVLAICAAAVLVGVGYAKLILWGLPAKGRALLQSRDDVTYNRTQPWPDFLEDAATVRVKTTDGELFAGDVVEWSRAGRPRQLRLSTVDRMNKETGQYDPVGLDDMLFFEENIERITLWDRDD